LEKLEKEQNKTRNSERGVEYFRSRYFDLLKKHAPDEANYWYISSRPIPVPADEILQELEGK
jgi:hypothetical protein